MLINLHIPREELFLLAVGRTEHIQWASVDCVIRIHAKVLDSPIKDVTDYALEEAARVYDEVRS